MHKCLVRAGRVKSVWCVDERCDRAPVIKASQEKKNASLTELIMKDPVADLVLKRQPLEYYVSLTHDFVGQKS